MCVCVCVCVCVCKSRRINISASCNGTSCKERSLTGDCKTLKTNCMKKIKSLHLL